MKTNSNFNVIQTLINWLQQGKQVWLMTVTQTWGSSPTPCGTLMAYCAEQGRVGSLSGGCIEEDLFAKIQNDEFKQQLNPLSATLQIVYGDNEAEQQHFQLPCGGKLHLLIESIQPSQSKIEHFCLLRDKLANRQKVARRISLLTDSLSIVDHNVDLKIDQKVDQHAEPNIKLGISIFDDAIEHGLGPDYQMLLIGASEVARCVAELAQPLNFKVSVWDHRKEFIKNWQVDGVEVYSCSPEKLINQYFSDPNNAIIALAHDPRVDDIALVDALSTQAFYIGAIGSKQTCAKRNQRLLNYLDDQTLLDKLHAPVGIDIGSKTPYEIAISILAEVIMQRRKLENKRL